jgi:hypothetical protein
MNELVRSPLHELVDLTVLLEVAPMTPPISRGLLSDPIELSQVVLSTIIVAAVAYTVIAQLPTPEFAKDALLFLLAFYFGKTVALNGLTKPGSSSRSVKADPPP